MGCNQSKIENEESIMRCKERKRFMKEAVSTRNAFAAAHSAYTTSLKNTGAALGDFAHGEVQNPGLIPTGAGAGAGGADNSYIAGPPQKPFEIPLPPPPLPDFSSSPLQRAASMPEIKISKPNPRPMSKPIPEEEEEERELENEGSLRRRKSNRNTGGGVGGGGGGGVNSSNRRLEDEDVAPPPMPPPPAKQQPVSDHVGNQGHHHHTMSQPQQNSAAWEYFFPSMENIAGTSLNEEAEEEARHTLHKMEHIARPNRIHVMEEVVATQRSVGVDVEVEVPLPSREPEHIPEPEVMMESPVESPLPGLKVKQMPVTPPPPMEAKRIVNHSSVNLLQIFADLDDHFLRASESAHEVSKLLEATRLHYHSNFADNRGTRLLVFFLYGLMEI